MRSIGFVAALAAGLVLALVGGAYAVAKDRKDNRDVRATLNGYQETPSISTRARGTFRGQISSGEIDYVLRYEGIEGGSAAQAHIHLGQRAMAGGVVAFLCGGGGKPACPATAGTVEGTIRASDVIGPSGQGIAAGEFDELVRAMRAGATYANVHSGTYGGGEIRGQIARGKK
jgi:hypothetical protein